MHRLPQSNSLPELNKTFRDLYKRLACLVQAAGFQFLFGSGDPIDDITGKGVYLNIDNNELWEYDSGWTLQATLGGGVGTQDLQSVLDRGNTATLQTITLFGSDSHFTATAGDSIASASIGVANEPFIDLTNSSNNIVRIRASLASNNNIELPANSGTLALLSDIPPATPTVIVTKTTSYTLQLADANNDTLFEMDAATDEDFIVDSAVAFSIGTSFIFARKGAGEVNIVAAGATVILSANGATNLTYQDSGATLIKVSATEWYLFGDIGDPITAVPGGNDREIQFNDGGTAFGGATGFTYDPTNTHGLLELVSTDDTKSLFSIQGPSTSINIFEVANEANPGVGNYFVVGANTGYMAGNWTISNGGKLTIATGSLGVSDMFKLTNVAGAKTHALSYTDAGDFLIRDVTNNQIDFFIDNSNGNIGFGPRAGNYGTVSGVSNTSIGRETLFSLTTGFDNTGVGAYCMSLVSTGSYNTGVGSGSLNVLSTGARNTAIGWGSMFESTAANYSTIAGWYAGRHVQGNYFTGLGYQAFGGTAGAITQTGQKNIAIGDNTAIALRTGSFNTVIGSEANVAAATDYGIALGYQAVAASNQLAISPNVTQIKATGITGANTAGKVLTTDGAGIATFQDSRPYQVLVGNLTQTGTSAPTFTIFENTTGTTFTTGYTGIGNYTITAVSGNPFTENKTQVYISLNQLSAFSGNLGIINTSFDGTNSISIGVLDVFATASNDVLYNTPIEIRIYP